LAYLAWNLYPNLATKISIGRFLAVHFAQVWLFSSNRIACAIKTIQGFVDGVRGRLGIRIRPGSGDLRKTGGDETLAEKVHVGTAP
jgi:hypothetical protein